MRHPHGLRAAAGVGGGELVFVGGSATSQFSTQTPSYSLTSLTGGLASSPSAGDIVIACISIVDPTDRDLQCTTSGYTEIVDFPSTDIAQLGVYYKVLSAADTTVAFDLGTFVSSRFCTHVWRGINATPLDAATTTASSSSSIQPDPPSITTVTNNAVVIAVGTCWSDGDVLDAAVAPTGMGNLYQSKSSLNAIMIASITRPSTGAYDPPSFTGLSTGAGDHCAATLALRPA